MIKQSVTLDEMIEYLNDIAGIDGGAINALIDSRVPCNAAMADHPTVQVKAVGDDSCVVGLLGIINGLFGIDERGYGAIMAILDENKPPLFVRAQEQRD